MWDVRRLCSCFLVLVLVLAACSEDEASPEQTTASEQQQQSRDSGVGSEEAGSAGSSAAPGDDAGAGAGDGMAAIAAGEPGSPLIENWSWPVVPVDVGPSDYTVELCGAMSSFAVVYDAAPLIHDQAVVDAAAAVARLDGTQSEVGAFFAEVQTWLEKLSASRAEYESLTDDEQLDVFEEYEDREQDLEDRLDWHDRVGIDRRSRLACEVGLPGRLVGQSGARGWQPPTVPAPISYPIVESAHVTPSLGLSDIEATVVWADPPDFETVASESYAGLEPSSEPVLILDMVVTNSGPVSRQDFKLERVALRLHDGRTLRLSDRSPSRSSTIAAEPGESQRVVLVADLTFARWDQQRIRQVDLTGAALVIGSNVAPAVLGFDGTVWGASSSDDDTFEVPDSARIEVPNFRDCTPVLDVTVRSAAVGPDASTLVPAEVLPEATTSLYERAFIGNRVVAFEFEVANTTTADNCDWSLAFDSGSWQVLSDGEVANSPGHTVPEVELGPGESATVVGWAGVAVGASDYELAFTQSDDPFDDLDGRVRIPLALPEFALFPGEAELMEDR